MCSRCPTRPPVIAAASLLCLLPAYQTLLLAAQRHATLFTRKHQVKISKPTMAQCIGDSQRLQFDNSGIRRYSQDVESAILNQFRPSKSLSATRSLSEEGRVPDQPPPAASSTGFEVYQERRPAGLVVRSFVTLGQLLALLFGGANIYVQQQRASRRARSPCGCCSCASCLLFARPFLDRRLIQAALPRTVPAYAWNGWARPTSSSARSSACAKTCCRSHHRRAQEPARSAPRRHVRAFKELIEADLKRPLDTIFRWIDPNPLGSASLAQTQRARLLTGERVVLKVLKPGVRQTVQTDTKLLGLVGAVLQIFLARYQPARLIAEFSRYTLREVDLRFEADNAEAFTANFKDQPDIHFPKIYREFSNRDVLCMAYFKGIKPDARAAAILTRQQKDRVIQLGISAIIQMIFADGFFHADLHPGQPDHLQEWQRRVHRPGHGRDL